MTETTETSPAKKPFEKRYKTVVPLIRGDRPAVAELGADDEHQDVTTARWLGRESFENTVAHDRLVLIEYSERLIPIADVDPRLSEALGRPVGDFDWFEFSGLGRLDQAMFDWHAAEFVWNCDQWLAAERAHFEALDAEHQAVDAEAGT
ncbi:hypothetical protein [Mycolicibacterium komossense]|uniref:Uncharacterized protein n=1 Tax=Mycolicibacterium komossense TaxID=1779 RepID=A0ABT3C9C1_9MYCO|nr:hypothetical protein [Mycolicibacterium komossense]MCV7226052.1 hypothetical protein [Mycolicibacterium komossense]